MNAGHVDNKPSVLFVLDWPGRAFDICARAIARCLASDFSFHYLYVSERPRRVRRHYDLVHVLFWGETYHRELPLRDAKLIKGLSSHRWETEPSFGGLTPRHVAERHLSEADAVVATSRRLYDAFRPHCARLFYCRNGVDTTLFHPAPPPTGPLKVGWCGNITDPAKSVRDILRPAIPSGVEYHEAPGDIRHEDLDRFYAGLDVICVSSIAEGGPLPLLEAMAMGCFAVTTDVGIVPEVVIPGTNGLVVERSIEAFREALTWCKNHVPTIRSRRRNIANGIAERWSWDEVVRDLASVYRGLLESPSHARPGLSQEPLMATKTTTKAVRDEAGQSGLLPGHVAQTYHIHFSSLGHEKDATDAGYRGMLLSFDEELRPLLDLSTNTSVLEIGIGNGYLLRWLTEQGVGTLVGVDFNETFLRQVGEKQWAAKAQLHCAEALEYLRECRQQFHYVILMDLFEHVAQEDGLRLAEGCWRVLVPGGKLLIRTPNMASVLGGFSRYIDLTHAAAYTEFSLRHLLTVAGFGEVDFPSVVRIGFRRRLKARLTRWLHEALYKLEERTVPQHFEKNLLAVATKGWSDA